MTNVIPVTQARRDLLKLVDKVDREYTRIDLTKKGKIKATLVSPDYLDSLEETVEILAIPGAKESIKKGMKEARKRKGIALSSLKSYESLFNSRGSKAAF